MLQTTGGALAQVASDHPVLTVHLAGTAATLAILTAIALARPRVFASVVVEFAVENRIDRRLPLGAKLLMWSIGWPVSVLVVAARLAWRR